MSNAAGRHKGQIAHNACLALFPARGPLSKPGPFSSSVKLNVKTLQLGFIFVDTRDSSSCQEPDVPTVNRMPDIGK